MMISDDITDLKSGRSVSAKHGDYQIEPPAPPITQKDLDESWKDGFTCAHNTYPLRVSTVFIIGFTLGCLLSFFSFYTPK